jgi:hypothetical protein
MSVSKKPKNGFAVRLKSICALLQMSLINILIRPLPTLTIPELAL